MIDEKQWIWCVRHYPDGALLHTDASYDACEEWRKFHDQASVTVPVHWTFFSRSTVN